MRAGFPIKDDFLEQSERLFGAKPVKLTGKQEEDLENINRWVKEATEGKIEDFLSELPDNTVLLLLNAIYFHGALFSLSRSPPLPSPTCPVVASFALRLLGHETGDCLGT